MKTTEIIVIIHFLEILRKQTQNSRLNVISSPAFQHLLSREQLIGIVNHMYEMEGGKEHENLDELSPKELIDIIGDEYYILSYFIEEVLGRYSL